MFYRNTYIGPLILLPHVVHDVLHVLLVQVAVQSAPLGGAEKQQVHNASLDDVDTDDVEWKDISTAAKHEDIPMGHSLDIHVHHVDKSNNEDSECDEA